MRIDAPVLTNDTDAALAAAAPSRTSPATRWCGGETTNPVWTHVIDVGDVTEATIDLSKDNVFFGVRAVEHRAGHRSPAVFPFRA